MACDSSAHTSLATVESFNIAFYQPSYADAISTLNMNSASLKLELPWLIFEIVTGFSCFYYDVRFSTLQYILE